MLLFLTRGRLRCLDFIRSGGDYFAVNEEGGKVYSAAPNCREQFNTEGVASYFPGLPSAATLGTDGTYVTYPEGVEASSLRLEVHDKLGRGNIGNRAATPSG